MLDKEAKVISRGTEKLFQRLDSLIGDLKKGGRMPVFEAFLQGESWYRTAFDAGLTPREMQAIYINKKGGELSVEQEGYLSSADQRLAEYRLDQNE